MSRQIQLRRGTATEHESFIGAVGEITMDTTNQTLRVHDGETPGGVALARADTVPEDVQLPENYDFVVEYHKESSANNSKWYRKYKSGRVDMGGHYTGNATVVTLPIQVQDSNYIVLITKNSPPAYWATTHLVVGGTSTKNFTIYQYGDTASLKVGWLIMNAIAAS